MIAICESTCLQKIFTGVKTREGIQDFYKDTGVEGSSLGSLCRGQALLDSILPSVCTSCICKTKLEIKVWGCFTWFSLGIVISSMQSQTFRKMNKSILVIPTMKSQAIYLFFRFILTLLMVLTKSIYSITVQFLIKTNLR